MRLSFCNELLAYEGKSLAEQAAIAAELGYMGLELALGSLSDKPHELSAAELGEMRKSVEAAGLEVTGLHWLLAPYPALSITDPAVSPETSEVLKILVDHCAALGGGVLVHGSPGQRVPLAGDTPADTRNRVVDFFGPIAERAAANGVTYCLEPLSPKETSFVNRVDEAAEIVDRIESGHFRTMIDTSAAGQAESMPVADLIRKWVPSGRIAHIQVNDTNRGAPGTGDDPFADIVAALRAVGWDRPLAHEPFVTTVDASVTAAIGAATMKAYWTAAG